MSRVRKNLPLAIVLLLASANCVFADSYFDQGKLLFDKRQFQKALPYFHKAAIDSPWDSSAAYYEALCYHQMRDWNNAKTTYKSIVEHFPGSPAYGNAMAALKVLDPAFIKSQQSKMTTGGGGTVGGGTTGGTADLGALMAAVQITAPNECKIPVQRITDKNWVDGSVNGRGFKFDFYGGETTSISSKDAKQMNLTVANGRAIVTVKVGQISETNFPIAVEEGDKSRLGTDFFQKFAYTLEPSNIVAIKKGGGGANSSTWEVPFRKKGKDMVIEVQCNGRRVSVVLDPDGSESVIPRSRAREFGMEVSESQELNMYNPDTNPNGALRGQAGFGEVKQVTAGDGKIVVGPCTSQVRFRIDDKAAEAKVSPSIFGGFKYIVDPAASKLRLTK